MIPHGRHLGKARHMAAAEAGGLRRLGAEIPVCLKMEAGFPARDFGIE